MFSPTVTDLRARKEKKEQGRQEAVGIELRRRRNIWSFTHCADEETAARTKEAADSVPHNEIGIELRF